MWQLAEIFSGTERNRRVLSFFAGFLTQVLHVDPARVEGLVSAILARVQDRTGRTGDDLNEAIGSVTVILWVTHARERSHAMLDSWLADAVKHEDELSAALHSIRDGLVVGYGTEDTKDAAIRGRCQRFAARVVEVSAAGMQQYFDLPPETRTEADQQKATRLAKLLDSTNDQLFFASGTFQNGQAGEARPLADVALKKQFLNDNSATFRRVGDVGTPHSVFHLIEMLGLPHSGRSRTGIRSCRPCAADGRSQPRLPIRIAGR
jgi:hypothetical protein